MLFGTHKLDTPIVKGNVIARAGFKPFNWKMSYRNLEGKVFILTVPTLRLTELLRYLLGSKGPRSRPVWL